MKFGDEELMVMFAAGVTEAFDMLYERYRDRVFRFGTACLHDPSDAEDLVQEVFLRVARSAARYKPRGRFRSWIFQIAANRIRTIGGNRRARIEMEAPGDPERLNLFSSDRDDVERSAVNRDLLDKSLSSLPEIQRLIVILKEVEGMPCSGIAESLDISHENVRVQLHRARKKLVMFVKSEAE